MTVGVHAVDLRLVLSRLIAGPVTPLQLFLFLSGEASIIYKVRQSLGAIISVDGNNLARISVPDWIRTRLLSLGRLVDCRMPAMG
jgi:hypothetical protein